MAKSGKRFSGKLKSLNTQSTKESDMTINENEIPMLPVTDDAEPEIPMLPVTDDVELTDTAEVPVLPVTDGEMFSPEVMVVDTATRMAEHDIYAPYNPENPNSGLDINSAVIMPLDAMTGSGILSLTQMMHLPTVRDVYWVCSECDTDTRKYRDGYHVCAEFDEGHVGDTARDKPVCPECAAIDAMVFHVDGGVPINTPVWDMEHQCWRANAGQVWDVSTQPGVTHCPFCCSLAQINVVSPLLWDCETCNIRLGNPSDEVILPTPVE